jgi:ankyrin repeat protein
MLCKKEKIDEFQIPYHKVLKDFRTNMERLPTEVLQNICVLSDAPDAIRFAKCNRTSRSACSMPWVKAAWLTRHRPTGALMRACATGNVDVVRLVLEISGLNTALTKINRTRFISHFNGSPFQLAACRGYVDIVELLLRTGIRINMRSSRNALVLAAEEGHTEVVRQLLTAPTVYINRKNIQHALCAQVTDMEVVQILADHAGVYEIKKALFVAILFGTEEVQKYLTVMLVMCLYHAATVSDSHKAAIWSSIPTFLRDASKHGSLVVVEILLQVLPDYLDPHAVANEVQLALFDASSYGCQNLGVIQLLLDSGGDVNAMHLVPPHTVLEEAGAQCDYEGGAEFIATELTRLSLLSGGVHALTKEAALRRYSHSEFPDAVELLLESGGFDAAAPGADGKSALRLAEERKATLELSMENPCIQENMHLVTWHLDQIDRIIVMLSKAVSQSS